MSIDEIIQLCYKYYPPNTKFLNAYNKAYPKDLDHGPCYVTSKPEFIHYKHKNAKPGISIKDNLGTGLVYCNGHFANVIDINGHITNVSELDDIRRIIYAD